MKEYQYFLTEQRDHILIVKINHPYKDRYMNLVSLDVLKDLRTLLFDAEKEKSVWCILLTGEGENFCCGADVNGFKTDPPGLSTAYGQSAYYQIERCPIPVVAAINGYCLGGGLEMALSCDIRFAAKNAKIGFTEANFGFIPAYGGNTRLAWLCGEGYAKKMFYAAEKISGEEAYRIGLVQGVYEPEELFGEALKYCEAVTKVAPTSNTEYKRVIFESRQHFFGGSFLAELYYGHQTAISEDSREAVKAFNEKRPPEFKNQ